MSTEVKIGIVVDNYKLSTYKRVLKAHGYEFTDVELLDNTTSILIETSSDKTDHLNSVCADLDVYFYAKQN